MGVCSRQGKLIQLDGMIVTEHRLLRWQVSTDENVYATIFSPCDFGFCLCDFFFSKLSSALLALPISNVYIRFYILISICSNGFPFCIELLSFHHTSSLHIACHSVHGTRNATQMQPVSR